MFQDGEWARRGIDALLRDGFAAESITILAHESPAVAALIESVLGAAAARIELKGGGALLGCGPLVAALEAEDHGLETLGLAATVGRAGFQHHDGFIFEALTGRGGVLVAVSSAPRAADALAKLHAYGGGNAAIGAWTGRV